MEILTFHKMTQLNNAELNDKILEIKKAIFDLQFKQATKKSIKTHLFKKYKRMLAQILTIKND